MAQIPLLTGRSSNRQLLDFLNIQSVRRTVEPIDFIHVSLVLLSSQLSPRTRAETLATQAKMLLAFNAFL